LATEDCSAVSTTAMQETLNSSAGRGNRATFRAWLYVVIWLAIIAIESTEALSAGHTGALLRWLLAPIFGPDSPAQLTLINAVVRKVGHFVGYGVLSVLLFRAWRATLNGPIRKLWEIRWAILATVFTVAIAALDEWHQTRLGSRTGSARDVLLDGCGALCAQAAIVLTRRV
jgi:VanZ family protein